MPPSKFPFFSLARETRDQIYHHLFLSTDYHIVKDAHVVNISYHESTEHHHVFPRWLLLSKATLSEGLAQFAQHAALTSMSELPKDFDFDQPGAEFVVRRDKLLLESVREVSLDLSGSANYHRQSAGGGDESEVVLQPRNNALDRNTQGYRPVENHVPSEIRTREFVPALERVTLRIFVDLRNWNACPTKMKLNALSQLRALGVGYKSVKIEVEPPSIQIIPARYGDEVPVRPVAVVAAVYPRLQLLVQQIGVLLTRGYAANAYAVMKKAVDEKHWADELWVLSDDSTVREDEAIAKRFGMLDMNDRKRTIKEWVNEETGVWHCEIKQATKVLDAPYASDARGLVAFTAPKFSIMSNQFDEESLEAVFKMDKVARYGSASYTCASTGEVFWIEDKVNGVTGYIGEGEEKSFHKAPKSTGFLALCK
jgi:hypothetical protein